MDSAAYNLLGTAMRTYKYDYKLLRSYYKRQYRSDNSALRIGLRKLIDHIYYRSKMWILDYSLVVAMSKHFIYISKSNQ
jgi:hypothetical protein